MSVPEIIYEDNHLLVAIKPAGVLSQADITGEPDMLNLLKDYLCQKYNKQGAAYLGLLHRLDRPVSGIMVFAKTSKCAARISSQIRNRTIVKKYRAIVRGQPAESIATLHSWIQKDSLKNRSTVLHSPPKELTAQAKESRLHYEVIGMTSKSRGGQRIQLSLLEIDLLTGRSHQIRAQLADTGIPILGDRKYGPDDHFYEGDICLEAFFLSFDHPVTGDRMTFSRPLSREEPWGLFL